MLKDIRVIEIATYIAAPSAGGLLADWGADVIKIEPPQGCPMRAAFETPEGFSPVFDLDNRGKRSLCIDISKPEGVVIVKKLLAKADIFLTNIRGKALHKIGLGYDQIKTEFPELIYAEVSGYGSIGPDKDLPGFDISAFFARSGITAASTPKIADPVTPRVAVGDHTTGIATIAGILAAFINRQHTKKGCFIDSSLLRTGIYTLGSDLATLQGWGRLGSAKPRNEVREPMSNFFKTSDERWLVLVPRPQLDKEWQKLCSAVAPDLGQNPDFDGTKTRRENCAEIVARLDEAFGKKTLAEWGAVLDDNDFVWSPLLKPSEVLEDPQANAMGAFIELPEGGGGGKRPSVGGPIRFVDVDFPTPGEVRKLGEDNDQVLKEFGFEESKIKELKSAGVLG